jgi:hypothetical protein
MSDEMKSHCPPETTAPKMHAHEATEKTEDIKPKLISTAHKRLSQDEFQRKVAMVARLHAGDNGLEKEAYGALARGLWALGGKSLVSNANKLWQGTKAVASTGILPSVANTATKTWKNLPARMLVGQKGVGSYLMHPVGIASTLAGAAAPAVPYVGGALQRLGGALGGSVGAGQNAQGFGGAVGGGLLGAGLGAVGGALMPGEEEYEDENGNIRKRRRGMLSGALRGAGMGGIAGGVGGAAMDYFGKQSAAQEFGAALARQSRA